MKVPMSWLQDHLDTQADWGKLTEALNQLGLVVDAMTNRGDALKAFKIVEVLEIAPHPQADRLKVCQIQTGQGIIQVVCGAPDVHTGLKGVLGQPGDYVPGLHITLKQTSIRGVDSHGMLCSFAELGLGGSSEGIISLPLDAPVGQNYAVYAGLDDPIWDVDITPNRGDCLGMRGIARDLHAKNLGTLKTLSYKTPVSDFTSCVSLNMSPEQTAKAACPYFMGRMIQGLVNCESPPWLQQKLKAVGLNPISALVDITNFMAYDLGRPMHVFDVNRLKGGLEIRMAQSGEILKALDGTTYALDSTMLVVADDGGPQAIAGIMGGQASGCQLDTTTIFLESAFFTPSSIAQTGRKLGILSDSRYRFERGADPAIVKLGLDRATQMILDLCGGQASEVLEVGALPHPSKPIEFDTKRLKSFGGMDVEPQEASEILERLGFMCAGHTEQLKVHIPSWRSDVEGPHDLIEEILRVKGYDEIPLEPLPRSCHEEVFPLKPEVKTRHQRGWIARRTLASRQFHEILTWSFMKEEDARCFGHTSPSLVLNNPISADLSTMRPSLVGNLVKCLQRNKDRGQLPSGLFEVGLDYQDTTLQGQRWVVAGVRPGYGTLRHWHHPHQGFSVYDIKADVFALLTAFGIDTGNVQLSSSEAPSYYHPGQSGAVKLGPETILGFFGMLHPDVSEALSVDEPLYVFEVFLEKIPQVYGENKGYIPSPYQPVERDLAFVVNESIPGSLLIDTVKKTAPHQVTFVDIFDVYRGPGIPEGQKSIGLLYRMEPTDKTLTDGEINETMEAIIKAIEHVTKGSLRR